MRINGEIGVIGVIGGRLRYYWFPELKETEGINFNQL